MECERRREESREVSRRGCVRVVPVRRSHDACTHGPCGRVKAAVKVIVVDARGREASVSWSCRVHRINPVIGVS